MESQSTVGRWLILGFIGVAAMVLLGVVFAQEPEKRPSSYAPVNLNEDLAKVMTRMKGAKADIMKRHTNLLNDRYDLSNRPAAGITMSRGKPVQEGVRVKLPKGVTWDQLAAMTPEEIKDKDLFPAGFMPLPHPNHAEGGMLFPQPTIDEVKKLEGRDLTRFDLDFDIPDHLLPEFPPPIYLTTRPDLGDVSQGKLVNLTNYYEPVFRTSKIPNVASRTRTCLMRFSSS